MGPFQSTPPARAATRRLPSLWLAADCFNPRRPRGRRQRFRHYRSPLPVSIHAAREGGDNATICGWCGYDEFQSTPPARAATRQPDRIRAIEGVSIHAAREGGDVGWCGLYDPYSVSIHAAREGGDVTAIANISSLCTFQSTPPARAATRQQRHCRVRPRVSIHAAREGGDAHAG